MQINNRRKVAIVKKLRSLIGLFVYPAHSYLNKYNIKAFLALSRALDF